MSAAALSLQGVSFSYTKREVLDDVSFVLEPGEFCVLLGINGAGKTTLFSLITRLFVSRGGSIEIYGYNLQRQTRKALAQLGVVFQQPTLDLDLSLLQNLRYHCTLQGLNTAELRQRMRTVLDEIGLGERADEKVRALSGGQRRRLELVRALLHQPRLLLADEPTVGLDIHSRQAILQQVRDRCREEGIGVLWATHLVDEVEPEDRLVVLHGGKVLARGSAREIMRQTATDSVKEAFNCLTRSEDS
ncbi:MAG: ABC transporter ATP-binding protein [gamma proteobacterium symbiont of Ctena orbiculata]|uniref:ATP-binding cassette domain-containing protein n=1 Tax=Candidatus Thiodiazotropha taylori TaxID=2792791 RepID=A0A944MAY5_9GAMM|nr:ATP-binding cassette domain-containing protein [Candidatus Thiodiazotropha taylori]PUB81452.1 MAG: ABC transporter ATP-binding protein [gamma proteobacterium symbiont of Ctena orbiculata]MBT2991196.1 ATP-binding cassette domain-containing protein [Candidatus Thiodiazotropha taylori]MBT2996510.1 ATP-binding cassette domain-containing protein [Candidatus Thiodiazotropha taylori]MBT3000550.1 ATP-binding cassette domain-containing protein [Candidatus Thiodiazotropha taylori]